ncbi:MAG: PD40 domain-containing protein [Bacteroidetes bacterium]|nr:PD40 domain-containing protein [Bacteroidota bacterium]
MRCSACIAALAVLFPLLAPGAEEGRFMRSPDIHGSTIVFTYEGDLWSVPASGGTAIRLTNHPGVETAARFSPDGSQLAFSATYDGPQAVYRMPSTGGEPTRLTYMPGSALAICWTPDGKRVVFNSMFENANGRDPNLYFVDAQGGLPECFPLDRGVRCSFSADGTSILYARRGSEEYYWKRYKGGRYQDIWRYDFPTRAFTPVSDYVGKNSYPMWIGNTMYFVSDRTTGTSNLYAQDLSTRQVTPLTQYADFDVMMPSTDGTSVVFMYNGYLHVMDVQSRSIRKISVQIPSDRWISRTRTIDAREYLHSADIAPDGETLLLEARGDLFRVQIDKKLSTNLSFTPGTREMHPAVSPDGKTVAFFSDKSGEYQLYTQPLPGGEWTQLTTTLDRTVYRCVWSPDGSKLLFGNKDNALFVLDVPSKKLTRIDQSNQLKNDEFYWEIADYAWSPDSKWVTYSHVQFNRNSQIFVYSLEQSRRYAVTEDFFDNLSPRFDAGGKYLYYLSSRNFDVQMDFYEDNHVIHSPYQVMAVQLLAGQKPPFADSVARTTPGKGEGFRIDTDGLQQRTFPLPVASGNYFYLRAGKGKVFWCSVPRFTDAEYEEIFKPGGATKWQLHIFDMAQEKEVTLTDNIREFSLSTSGEHLLIRRNDDLYLTTPEQAFKTKATGEKVATGILPYTVVARAEWNQIFSDTWRWYRDFFYDENMHGRDWKKMGETYRSYLGDISSRDDLNWVLQQMVGELCVSHTYIGGGDMGPETAPKSPVISAWLGADVRPDAKTGYYRFDKIYGPTEYNLNLKAPLARPDIDLKEGDYLIAINGVDVKPPADFYKHLQITPGQKVSVTVNNVPTRQGARTYEIVPDRYNGQLRYFRWLTENVNYVLKASGGKIGYMHITAMGDGGIGEFDKFWRAFRYKDGLIIDVRRNSGGWTEYFLIDKLERKMVANNVLRNMVPFRYPGTASSAHYAALSNELNGSDGEAFIEHFKARKLGTVIGVPSWGGLVGIVNGQLTIDNGTVQQSNNAFFGKDGTWLVENHGAEPDILIENDPASVMAGKDLQLDKAIEVLLRKIQEQPFTFPPVPPYPKK